MIYFIAFIAFCLIFVSFTSCIDNNRLAVREYDVKSDKITKDVRIVFLSDMHNNSIGKDNYKLIGAIREANPDLVLIGGDMLTAKPGCPIDAPVKLVNYLKEYKVFYGMGNHEYRMKLYEEDYGESFEKLVYALEESKVNVLLNNKVSLDSLNIDIQGLMIDREFYKRFEKKEMTQEYLEKTIGIRDDRRFRIMLAHNPEYFDSYSKQADLVLSGHVHGGIMVLPFLGGVVSPRFTLFPKYDGGRFDKNNSTMIVSRGLGSHTIPLRVFNPAELIVINLKK